MLRALNAESEIAEIAGHRVRVGKGLTSDYTKIGKYITPTTGLGADVYPQDVAPFAGGAVVEESKAILPPFGLAGHFERGVSRWVA